MPALSITEHMAFNLETQLQLDRMWTAWASYDKAGDYLNDAWNNYNDKLWADYQTALDAAYKAVASAEVDSLVSIICKGLRSQFRGQQAYKCLAAELNGQVQ